MAVETEHEEENWGRKLELEERNLVWLGVPAIRGLGVEEKETLLARKWIACS
jgi:hypothetical protein